MTGLTQNEIFEQSSFLQGANATFVEQLYARYVADPSSVEPAWREFFERLGDAPDQVTAEAAGAQWRSRRSMQTDGDDMLSALAGDFGQSPTAAEIEAKIRAKASEGGVGLSDAQARAATIDSIRALMLIRAYRIRGHLIANLDPLGMRDDAPHPELEPTTYGFTTADLDRPIFIDNVLGLQTASLREIVRLLKRTYCGTFALQYMHISDPQQAAWLKERIEGYDKEIRFTREGRKAILKKLVEAEGFEKFLHVKYMGTKRFGIDGGEALIPAMEQIIKRGGALGGERDRHRHAASRPPERPRQRDAQALSRDLPRVPRRLVQTRRCRRLGRCEIPSRRESSDREFDGNKVHLSLTANPSHLEAVNPVVMGKARAKQDQLGCPPDRPHRRHPATAAWRRGVSPAKAWSPSRSAFRGFAATGPAARSISSSTTRSASRPRRITRARRPTRRTWR